MPIDDSLMITQFRSPATAQFPSRRSAGNGAMMRFVFAILAACFLIFSLTSGTSASAALSAEPATTEMAFHHEGDGDEVPDCPFSSGQHHHHSQFGEHQPALPCTTESVPPPADLSNKVALTRDLLPPGLNPAFEPHPPKA